MNKETMRKHYETTPKDILINILISSREEVEKLQSRNKDKEIERLNDIIEEVREYIESYNLEYLHETNEHNLADILEELLEILDKVDKEK